MGASARGSTDRDPRRPPVAPRAAVLAAFVALLVHTMAYAGFFEDPITWVLLAVGASLAHAAARRSATRRRVRRMSGYLRRLATTGAAYTAASILSKLIAVALLPLYTRYLTTGRLRRRRGAVRRGRHRQHLVRLGLIEAMLRFYYQDDEDPARVVASTFAGALLARDARRRWSRCRSPSRSPKRCSTQPGSADRPELVRIAIGGLWVLTMFEFMLTLFRLEERARAFFVTTILNVLATIALTVVLVVGAGRGRPRPAARQLRERRRLRPRPDRPAVAPPLAALRPRRCCGASSASACRRCRPRSRSTCSTSSTG